MLRLLHHADRFQILWFAIAVAALLATFPGFWFGRYSWVMAMFVASSFAMFTGPAARAMATARWLLAGLGAAAVLVRIVLALMVPPDHNLRTFVDTVPQLPIVFLVWLPSALALGMWYLLTNIPNASEDTRSG